MTWMILYADLIGGILGIAGSVVLATPLVSEIGERRQWEAFLDFLQRYSAQRPDHVKTPEEFAAEREIRDHFLTSRLGGYRRYRRTTMTGLALLLAAFAFMTLATGLRVVSE